MATTEENLRDAFAGESQANRRYLAWAKKAERDGFPQIARLFRATAEAETVHAHGHLDAMGGVKSTKENLKEAIGGETYEYTEMYPPMYQKASEDGHAAKRMFHFALKVEEVHASAFQKALAALEAGKDLEGSEVYLCPICGHLEIGKPPDSCPVCGNPAENYQAF